MCGEPSGSQMLAYFAADFFAPYVQSGALRGSVKKSQDSSGGAKTDNDWGYFPVGFSA